MTVRLPDLMPPVPTDVKDLQKLEGRYRRDDGKVTKDEAMALLRQAGKDGTVSKDEMSFLRSRLNDTSFTPDARAALNRFVSLSGGTAETGNASSAKTIAELRDTYANDDGKIDRGELKAIMKDAMSSGRTLDREEVQQLHNLASDPRLTPDAKKDLEALLKFFPKPETLPPPPQPQPEPQPAPGGMTQTDYQKQLEQMQAQKKQFEQACQKLGIPLPHQVSTPPGGRPISDMEYLQQMSAIQADKRALQTAAASGKISPQDYLSRMQGLQLKERALEVAVGAIPNSGQPGGPSAPPITEAGYLSQLKAIQDGMRALGNAAAQGRISPQDYLAQMQALQMKERALQTSMASRQPAPMPPQPAPMPGGGAVQNSPGREAQYLQQMHSIQMQERALQMAAAKGGISPADYLNQLKGLQDQERALQFAMASGRPLPQPGQAGSPSAPPMSEADYLAQMQQLQAEQQAQQAAQGPFAMLQNALQQLQQALAQVQSGAADALSGVLSTLAQQIRDMGTASRITTAANRYRGDDGKITSDEARAILREAGKDGGLSTATQRQLAAMMMFDPSLTSGARRELARVVGPSLGRNETESKTDSVSTLRDIASSYRGDDGKIDRGELRQILSEALRNGGGMGRQEVDYLRTLSSDPSLTQSARTELNRFLDAFPQPPQTVAIYA